jgi:diguanylate cyclase (GGDEF)-like protein/PAS domain S-box-containing protein
MTVMPHPTIVELLLDAVCMVDAEGCFKYVSPSFERIFGYAPQEVVGRRMIELVHSDDRERTLRAAQNIMAGALQYHFENRYVRKDGQIAHIRWTARWVPEQQVRLAVAHDITERRHTEALQAAVYSISEAAQAAEDLVTLFAHIHQTIGTLLPAANFTVALHDRLNESVSFPYHVNERHPAPAPHPLDADALYSRVIRNGQTLLLSPDDSTPPKAPHLATAPRPLYWLGVPLHTQAGVMGALVLQSYCEEARYSDRDKELLQFVSTQVASAIERTQMRKRLQHMAQYDQLTHLPNRQLFLDRLKTALTRARREQTLLSLLFVDLDHFKQVNDTLGHAMGDLLLQRVAQRLLECVRASDTVARLGGDEFVVLLESSPTSEQATAVAEKILAAFIQPFDLDGHQLPMRPSIGIAIYPDHGGDESLLLSHADAAMYMSKKSGGNQAHMAGTPGHMHMAGTPGQAPQGPPHSGARH